MMLIVSADAGTGHVDAVAMLRRATQTLPPLVWMLFVFDDAGGGHEDAAAMLCRATLLLPPLMMMLIVFTEVGTMIAAICVRISPMLLMLVWPIVTVVL